MEKMKFYLNKKFFIRYFAAISVSLFVIITIVIAAFGNYAASRQKYREQINAFADFEEKRKSVENTLSIAVSLGRMTAESENVKEFAAMKGEYAGGNYLAITKIHQSLKQSQSDFHYMEFKIWMFTEQNELVISGSETMTKKNLKKESGISASSVPRLFADNQSSGYVTTLIPDTKNEKRAFIACRQVYDNGSKVYLLISLPNNTYAYSKKYDCGFIMDKSNGDIWKKLSSDKMFFGSATVRSVDMKNKSSAIMYANIESMPKLVYVTEYKYKRAAGNYVIIGLLLFGGLILSLWLAYSISKYLYSPINEILGVFDDEEFHGGDELEFIIQNTTKILNTNKNLSESLKGRIEYQKNKFLFDLFNGFVWGQGIEDGIKEFELEFIRKNCLCVSFGIEDSCEFGEIIPSGEFDRIKAAVFEFIRHQLSCTVQNCGILLENGKMIFIIPCDNSEKTVISIINQVKEKIGVRVVSVLSNEVKTVDDYRNEYSDIIEIHACKYLWKDRDIVVKEESSLSKGYGYSFESEHILVNYILSGEMERAVILFNRIVERALEPQKTDLAFEFFKSSIIETMKRVIYETNMEQSAVFGEGASAAELLACSDREKFRTDIKLAAKKLIYEVYGKIKGEQQYADDEILKYIDEHSSEDISMNDVCERFKLSASTITRRLHDRYNINFKTYLDDIRIEKAKKLMKENPNEMIKTIAVSVGYANITSFNRMFKRKEGVSPGQYIKKYTDGEK